MALILKIIYLIVAALVAFFMAILDYSKTDKKTKIYKLLRIFLYGFLLILFILSIWTTVSDHKSTEAVHKMNIESGKRIDSLTRINNILSLTNSYKIDTSLIKLDHTIQESRKVLNQLKIEEKNILNIHKLSKNIQYPLPKKVKTSFYVRCKFDDSLTAN